MDIGKVVDTKFKEDIELFVSKLAPDLFSTESLHPIIEQLIPEVDMLARYFTDRFYASSSRVIAETNPQLYTLFTDLAVMHELLQRFQFNSDVLVNLYTGDFTVARPAGGHTRSNLADLTAIPFVIKFTMVEGESITSEHLSELGNYIFLKLNTLLLYMHERYNMLFASTGKDYYYGGYDESVEFQFSFIARLGLPQRTCVPFSTVIEIPLTPHFMKYAFLSNS